jgi:hypothetical protein
MPRSPRPLAVAVALVLGCGTSSPGAAPATDARVAAWREDLRYLANELPARHARAFFHADEPTWRAAVADLDARLPTLDDAHVRAGLARLVAALGDGHTKLGVFAKGPGVYPLALTWFEDGIFVTGISADAGPDTGWALGKQLVAIGPHPIAEVIAAMTPLSSHDNDAGLRDELPVLLLDPALLAGVDLAPADHATFRLADAQGTPRDLELRPARYGAPITLPTPLPVHLRGPNTGYWNTFLPDSRTLFFAYNACADDPKVGPFATFAAGTLAYLDQHPTDRVVIDLRKNSGGDSRIFAPLLDGLAARPALAGRVFAIIGMHTFSSAIINAMELRRRVHATLVGGPTGGDPSGYGEVKLLTLPRSKLLLQYSTKKFANPDFPGGALAPDLAVHVTSADWFAGKDPALDAILAAPLPAK